MTRLMRIAAACACAVALMVAGSAVASAGMKPQKISGKVELVNMGKHAFSTTGAEHASDLRDVEDEVHRRQEPGCDQEGPDDPRDRSARGKKYIATAVSAM